MPSHKIKQLVSIFLPNASPATNIIYTVPANTRVLIKGAHYESLFGVGPNNAALIFKISGVRFSIVNNAQIGVSSFYINTKDIGVTGLNWSNAVVPSFIMHNPDNMVLEAGDTIEVDMTVLASLRVSVSGVLYNEL